jgi:hypothetical protein
LLFFFGGFVSFNHFIFSSLFIAGIAAPFAHAHTMKPLENCRLEGNVDSKYSALFSKVYETYWNEMNSWDGDKPKPICPVNFEVVTDPALIHFTCGHKPVLTKLYFRDHLGHQFVAVHRACATEDFQNFKVAKNASEIHAFGKKLAFDYIDVQVPGKEHVIADGSVNEGSGNLNGNVEQRFCLPESIPAQFKILTFGEVVPVAHSQNSHHISIRLDPEHPRCLIETFHLQGTIDVSTIAGMEIKAIKEGAIFTYHLPVAILGTDEVLDANSLDITPK